MNNNKVIVFYLFILAVHVAHVLEEVWGRFWLINGFWGLGWFLALNWILFCLPVVLFYFVLNGRRWAYKLSIAYAVVMIINGLGHNIAVIVTGRYFDGFAGGFSGIGLVLTGPLLIYHLRKSMPH